MESWGLSGAGPGPLWGVPYAARCRFPGEDHDWRGPERHLLPGRRNSGRLAGPEPARPMDAQGNRRDAQDRTQPPRHSLGEHGGCSAAQHAVHERCRPAGHRHLPQVSARRQGGPAHAGGPGAGAAHRDSSARHRQQRSQYRRRRALQRAGRPLHQPRRTGLSAILRGLPPRGRRRRQGRLPLARGQSLAARRQPQHADPHHADRLDHAGDPEPSTVADHAGFRPVGRPGDR